eukprot:CAMPEP_0204862894 /NCGR_PEP_ID=MMETSP1348-20121228/2898_1 /ASSEMBLY_ACC=CAM_ASM_000700 /TAXON_ID=215587 /ORGANISM="Aplanochytrium stocchinoi, Strain GSBS06" /LENGTH=634 /DNA_ID=CAMNT_0052013047 /DNA_START=347 /DNA_END=2251 /DNA_ORIENTATION=-
MMLRVLKPILDKYSMAPYRSKLRLFESKGGAEDVHVDPMDVFSLALSISINLLQGPKICWRPGRQSLHKLSNFDLETFTNPNGNNNRVQKSLARQNRERSGSLSSADSRNSADSQGKAMPLPEFVQNLKFRLRGRESQPQELVCLSGVKCIQIQASILIEKKRREPTAEDTSGSNRKYDASLEFNTSWISDTLRFDNSYFKELLNRQWEKVNDRRGNDLFYISKDEDGLVLEPDDISLLNTKETLYWVKVYSQDKARFFQDFAFFFTKLQEDNLDHGGIQSEKSSQNARKLTVKSLSGTGSSSRKETIPVSTVRSKSPETFYFAEELKLFTFRAALKVHVTRTWSDNSIRNADAVLAKVQKLTATPKSRAVVFRERNPLTPPDYEFDLHDVIDREAAVAVTRFDKSGVSKYKPQYVPKYVSEEEYFANYFSHILALRVSLGVPSRRIVLIGSKNPVKINATKLAFQHSYPEAEFKSFEFIGMRAPSLVADQPVGDEETKRGAINRAKYCYQNCIKLDVDPNHVVYTLGLEGGIKDTDKGYECFAWISVYDVTSDEINSCRTASFELPQGLTRLLKTGVELGTADDMLYKRVNGKQGSGTVGILTGGVIDRTEYYRHCAILALAPFAQPEVHNAG